MKIKNEIHLSQQEALLRIRHTAEWRSNHLGLFFLLRQILGKTKLSPKQGLKCEDDMKQIAFMVLALFCRGQSYEGKLIQVKEKMKFFALVTNET